LQATLERARQGDVTVLPQLQQALDDNPSIWKDGYDLVAMSEQAWIDKLAGTDLLLGQSLRRHVRQLKLDQVGASPTPLDKLLADRIAAAWLGVHHAELAEAFGDASGGKVGQMRLKRLEAANKRFLAATKALAVGRRLTQGLKIEINHTTQSPAVESGSTVPNSTTASGGRDTGQEAEDVQREAVRERLRAMFNEEAAEARDVTAGVGL